MKRLYLSLKGYGDLVVLAYSLCMAPQDLEVEVIVSERLVEMAKVLMPPKVLISSIASIHGPLPLYSLRNKGLKIFDGIADLRKAVKKSMDNGSALVLDKFSYRNEALFYLIPHSYLPKAENIYFSYALEFGSQQLNISSVKNFSKAQSSIIFPFGSSADRSMSNELIEKLCNLFSKKNVVAKIVCHESDRARIPMKLIENCVFFKSSDELVQLIKGVQLLISVDTVAIHLANYFDIPTFVVSDGWIFFIPPNVLSENRLYQSSQSERLRKDLNCFLGGVHAISF